MIIVKKMIKRFLVKKKFPSCMFYNNVYVDKYSSFGIQCVLFSDVSIINSVIGKRTYVQKNSTIHNTSIGSYCSIASDVNIGLAEHPTNMISTSPVFYDNTQPLEFFFCNDKQSNYKTVSRTTIESDVWIGHGALIKSGITIGVGSVIGAGAVVVKDVAPYSIVGGCPAKHIKWRFEEVIRLQMIRSKWWDLSDMEIEKLSDYYAMPELLIKEIFKDNI